MVKFKYEGRGYTGKTSGKITSTSKREAIIKLKEKGIRAMDVAKRLLDNGLHPPTVYFPLLVKEALMIEPTESESKQDLDKYIQTLCTIAKEDSEKVKNAPFHTPVGRVDEVSATKNQQFTWHEDVEKKK